MVARRDVVPDLGRETSSKLTHGLAVTASLVLFVGLPVLMGLANKCAPLMLALGALLANGAALSAVPPRMLVARYGALARTGTAVIFIGLTVLALASLLWTIDVGATRRGLTEALPELLFAWALAAAWPFVFERRHFDLLKVGLLAAAALILFEAFAGMPLHRLFGERTELPDLKRSAVPLVLLLWPCVEHCLGKGQRWWALLLGAVALAAACAAHSSASVVAVLLSAGIFAAARWSPRAMLGLSTAAAVACLMMAPWAGAIVDRALSTSGRAMLAEQHADIRIGLWTNFGRHVDERLLLGHGFDTSLKVAEDPQLAHTGEVPMVWNVHPHNAMLQIWVELGLVGAIGMAGAIGFCAARLQRLPAGARAFRLAFIGSNAAVALVGLNAWIPWWLAVVALGLVCFLVLREEQTSLESYGAAQTSLPTA